MTGTQKTHVLVLMGGPSSEHAVSLETGKNVVDALEKKYFRVSSLTLPKNEKYIALSVLEAIRKFSPDVVFIAMHGEFGEDGKLQGLLECAGISFTGSNSYSSALAMDKHASALLFKSKGLVVPRSIVFHSKEVPLTEMVRSARAHFDLPMVIKPVDRGSSVGVSIVRKKDGIRSALAKAISFSPRVMMQEYIHGREVTCGVLEHPRTHKPRVLIPTEILPQVGEFYSYDAKYSEGGTIKKTPPELAGRMIEEIKSATLLAHEALLCRGMSRTDMLIKGEKIYVLEVNTIPGMTKESLLPRGAHAFGIKFPEMLRMIIESAL